MLSLNCVLEIRRLLDEGRLSQRKIAVRLGVSRSTVGLIATGQRPLVGREASSDPSPWDYYSDQLPSRCPECGGMVFKPCVLCRARGCRRRQRCGTRWSACAQAKKA